LEADKAQQKKDKLDLLQKACNKFLECLELNTLNHFALWDCSRIFFDMAALDLQHGRSYLPLGKLVESMALRENPYLKHVPKNIYIYRWMDFFDAIGNVNAKYIDEELVYLYKRY